jgi:succinate dehydrogenase/fumarate reductase iron-sulfur protein
MMEPKETSRVKVLRFDPDRHRAPFYQEYVIPYEKEDTILDALYTIYRSLDGTLAFRGSCFAGGWCNVCAVRMNGKPILACKQFMERDMVIEPMPGYPVLRDLIVDFGDRQKSAVDDGPCKD